MWKGDLKGKIATDSLNNKETYGLGPIEFLKGEIVVFEGQTYVSKVRLPFLYTAQIVI